jgi:uncharacterized membrane protein
VAPPLAPDPMGDQETRRAWSDTQGPGLASEGRGLGFERLVFFSDAVFAIAITLLIIDVRLPELPPNLSEDAVREALGDLVPKVFAYVLSFATIGLYWLAHWRRFRYIARVDERLVGLNLVLLGLIAFIPFPTTLMGDQGDHIVSVVIYAISLSAAGIVGPLTWLYAWRAGLVLPGIGARFAQLAAFRGFSVPIVMLGSLALLPLLGPGGVTLTWLLIVPVQILLNRYLHAREGEHGAPRD